MAGKAVRNIATLQYLAETHLELLTIGFNIGKSRRLIQNLQSLGGGGKRDGMRSKRSAMHNSIFNAPHDILTSGKDR
jgi:hypothetical protein